MSPEELLEKLIALIPLPRTHSILYSGCFVSHHHLRAKVIKRPGIKKGFAQEEGCDSKNPKIVRLSWSKLLSKFFKLDMTVCQNCDVGKLRFIAVIKDPMVIARILVHLGES